MRIRPPGAASPCHAWTEAPPGYHDDWPRSLPARVVATQPQTESYPDLAAECSRQQYARLRLP